MVSTREGAEAPPRSPLSRERVLETAVALADKEGLDGLSMRRLAKAFGVVPMALYKHVANKEDMLDGMVDVVFAEIALPSLNEHWKSGMRRRAVSARRVLARHRWAIGLTESRTKPGATNLRHHDSVFGCLRTAGFPIEIAIHVYSTLDSYIYGFALQEQQLPFEGSGDAGEVLEQILQQFPVSDYPHLAETVAEITNRSGWKYADEFDFGLDLILDGLERFLTS